MAGGGFSAVFWLPDMGAAQVHLRAILVLACRRGLQEPQLLEELIAAHVYSSINELVHKALCMALQERLHLANQDHLLQPKAAQPSHDLGL